MKVKDLHILDRHYCVHADAYLVIGTAKNGLPGYVTGWRPRHSRMLYSTHTFLDIDSAKIHFNSEMTELESFLDPIFNRDHQEQAVYSWEDKQLLPMVGKTITKDEARALIQRVADDHDIPAPQLLWMPNTNSSSFEEETNKLRFGHRDMISLLHEMAHALYHHRRDGERYADHAPAFVLTAIELYHTYAGIDLDTLIHTARKSCLLGDIKAIQYISDISETVIDRVVANDNRFKVVQIPKMGPRP